jgi:pimeloyl-ACP methyl ester carboxylesterase
MHPEAVKFMESIYANFHARREKEYLFSDEELKRLNMPTLFVGGAEDALIPMDGAIDRMKKLVPQLEIMLIPSMGHVLINLSEQILPFLTAS